MKPRRSPEGFTLLPILLLLGLSPLYAGVISLESRVDVSVQPHSLGVDLTVTNRGDESAYNVQVRNEVLGVTQESSLQPRLDVGKDFSARFRFPLEHPLPGRYPVILRILYTDANRYPFSALVLSNFSWQRDALAGVLGILDKAQFRSGGRLHLKAKDLDGQAKSLRVRLLLPLELSAATAQEDIALRPGEEVTVPFAVRNFSALEGSTYPVYAIIEYDAAGTHVTTLAPGLIRIGPSQDLQRYGFYLLVGLIAVLGLFLLYNFRMFLRDGPAGGT